MVESISIMDLVPTGARDIEAATDLMRRFSDQDLTLVDSVGLHLMETRGISMCWSTDHHLGLTGVQLAIHLQ